MKVEVHRTIKNVFKAQNTGDKIVVIANWRLSQAEIKNILRQNEEFLKKNVVKPEPRKRPFSEEMQCKEHACSGMVNTANTAENGTSKTQPTQAQGCDNQTICNMFCGKSLMLFGEIYPVQPSAMAKTYIDNGTVYLSEDNYADKETRIKALKLYLRRIAKISLSSQVSNFGSAVSLCPEKIDFREVSDGWAKCTDASKKAITIDFRTIQLPTNLQHYVVVHAFTHFKHANHNTDFWHCLSNFLPNYEECIKQLERYDFLKEI